MAGKKRKRVAGHKKARRQVKKLPKRKKRVSARAAKEPKLKRLPKRELNEYKKLLLDQKELITGEIQHIAKDMLNKSPKDAAGDLSGYTYHIADVASDNYERDFSLGIASSESEVVFKIDEALKRVEDGTYGHCLECNKLITKKRLKAIPHAEYCIKCQKNLEGGKPAS